MAYWSEFPQDLLSMILQKLTHVVDSINFSRVCRYWGIIARDYLNRFIPYGAPCLMIPGTNLLRDTSSQSRSILAFPVGKNIDEVLHSLPKVRVPHLDLCRGSHHGWLAMITNNMDMYLFNPFSHKHIDLPCAKTLKKPSPIDSLMCKWYIDRILLSTSITDDYSNCFVLVIYGRQKELAFCKVGDKCWKYFHRVGGSFVDAAIYCKDKWYILEGTGEIYTCDPHCGGLDQTITLHKVDQTLTLPTPREFFFPYLLELRGEILQICRYSERGSFISYDSFVSEEEYCEEKHLHGEKGIDSSIQFNFDGAKSVIDTFDYDNFIRLPCSRFCSRQTTTFKVFKLERTSKETKPSWIEIDNFNGDSLFLGLNQSFFISNPHLFGYKGNHIYCTDDFIGFHKDGCVTGHDVGIFSMKEGTIEPLYRSSTLSMRPPAIWVIPKP